MAVDARINKSTLSATQKRQVKKALKASGTTVYVNADQTLTQSSTTHQAITSLKVPVEKYKTYKFTAWVHATADAGDGAQVSFTGSATADFIKGVWSTDGATASTPTSTLISGITVESDATEGTAAQVLVTAFGTYRPSVDGYLQLAAAQAVSGATDTVIKKGSWLSVEEIF